VRRKVTWQKRALRRIDHQENREPLGRQPLDRLGRVPAFDGLRALAVAAVMGFHLGSLGVVPGGWVGVNCFFALSGFLVTKLLLEERDARGRVDLLRFHTRRAARLLPALGGMLAAWLLVLVVAHA
jgi:peptidoglycan/LPS O-acetylase OafA/YrhL